MENILWCDEVSSWDYSWSAQDENLHGSIVDATMTNWSKLDKHYGVIMFKDVLLGLEKGTNSGWLEMLFEPKILLLLLLLWIISLHGTWGYHGDKHWQVS